MKKIMIIDYNAGNLFSVIHACKKVGADPFISSDKHDFKKANAVILPGVGAFGESMNNLNRLDLTEPILEFIQSGKQFMGICLGLQLLFSCSEEFGETKGLDLIKGKIQKFSSSANGVEYKVPHVGWNKIQIAPNSHNRILNTPLSHFNENEYMYFVHSYYAKTQNISDELTTCYYANINFTSSVLKDNIFATQFHPEKSGEIGLNVYKNWIKKI